MEDADGAGATWEAVVKFVRYWLPVLAYVALIFALSSRPNLRPQLKFEFADKVAHIMEYGGLGVLTVRALRSVPRFRAPLLGGMLALFLGLVVGISDELFQSTVPNRDSNVLDVVADMIGLALAQLVYLVMRRD
jgi:VanZ family protein